MTENRREANLKSLAQTEDTQNKTKDALRRISRDVEETTDLGTLTLEKLRREGEQMNEISSDQAAVEVKLDQTKALQNTFDVWNGNWLGGILRPGNTTVRSERDTSHVKEVFQQEKFNPVLRHWIANGLVLCSDTTVSCIDLFDPAVAQHVESSSWVVDFSPMAIDTEGWTYGTSFDALDKSDAASPTSHWDSFVRRRKWIHKTRTGSGGHDIEGLLGRNDERKVKAASPDQHQHAEKVGYVPREHVAEHLYATGLSCTSTSRGNSPDQRLDSECAAGLQRAVHSNEEIDTAIDGISAGLDHLHSIGAAMKDEVTSHHQKLEKMETTMQDIAEKQHGVNLVTRHQLNANS